MASRLVRPETRKLEISEGDWLLVKKRLTNGEVQSAYSRMYRVMNGTGTLQVDPVMTGLSMVVAYLVDWSLTDDDARQIVIREQDPETVIAALQAIDHDSFVEIRDAISAHETAMTAEREAQKKMRRGATPSPVTSRSPGAVSGAMSGSPTSTPTSTTS
jgi:hypothetical protein